MFTKVASLLIVLFFASVSAIREVARDSMTTWSSEIQPNTRRFTTTIQRVSRRYAAEAQAYSYIRLYNVRGLQEARTFNGEILLSQGPEFGVLPITPDEIDNKLKLRGLTPSTSYTIGFLQDADYNRRRCTRGDNAVDITSYQQTSDADGEICTTQRDATGMLMNRDDANNLYDGIVEITNDDTSNVIACGWIKETTIRHGNVLGLTIFRGI